MPLPKQLGRFNRLVTNQVTKLFVTRAPGFGVVIHQGRRSGRIYRTPVNVFPTPDAYAIALTYGPDADWVKNVLAAGTCELESQGRVERLYAPRIVHDETRRQMPPLVRAALRLMRVSDFMMLSRQPERAPNERPLSQAVRR